MMKEYLASFNLLTDEEIDSVASLVSVKKVKKGDYFIRAGAIAQEVAFVKTGFLRSYYHNSSGEEVTYCFTFSNSFLAAYSSFLSQEKTAEHIQALMDVELYTISRSVILSLEQTSTNWLRLFKLLAEQEYISLEKRIFLLQKESAEKRYLDLLQNQPTFLQMIPLQYLASYLGITQRHLSRIRSAMSN